ncbi:Transcriptional repressor scratch 1 [Halotydeus destructor]|nr:Transcriptional repressor scratch 1 [Halotydeus destructor]
MPRAFLITNRRYDLSPPLPSPKESNEDTSDSATGFFNWNAIYERNFSANYPDTEADVQAEAQDLSLHNRQRHCDGRQSLSPRFTSVDLTKAKDSKVPSMANADLPAPPPVSNALNGPMLDLASSMATSPSSSFSEGSESGSSLGTESHICPDCGKRYSTSSNLARHRQTHRSVTDKKARKCPHCEKVYVSMPAYSMHVRTHSQGCECPYCGKCFSRPWLLQGHIRTHTGEKPFKCPICSKAFADKSNLRAHVQTHSTNKPYVCERCGKAFALKSYLYKHEESSCMRMHRITGSTSSTNEQLAPSPSLTVVNPINIASPIIQHPIKRLLMQHTVTSSFMHT